MSGRLIRALVLVALVAACSKSAKRRALPPGAGRPTASMCAPRPPGQPDPGGGSCKADADCTAGKDGRCTPLSDSHGRMPAVNTCSYDLCAGDADCKGGPCECDATRGNRCL